MEYINSPIFGETSLLDPNEENFKILKHMIKRFPVNAFGIVNKLLNKRGLHCVVGRTEDS